MATDFNITMKQYNGVDYDTLYPETKGSQIITPVPIASGGTNSSTASGAMNNLITALSTITPANNDLIPFKDSSGNTVGKATISSLASVLQSVGGYAKIQTGSYVGTGTYGSSNPCSLTFDFVPKCVLISSRHRETSSMVACYPVANTYISDVDGTITLTWNDNTFKWYGDSANRQFNTSKNTYGYIALA